MTWFIEKPDRFVSERRAVAALAGSESWLSHYAFRFDESIRLVLRFTLRVAETDIQLDLRYPRFYPETPPEVVPLHGELKLSAHQWAGGALCLQHRTDNWRTDVNAADLIRSAYELLTADVTEEGGARALPASHDFTWGQYLRPAFLRHLYAPELIEMLAGAPERIPLMATMRFNVQQEAVTSWITTVDTAAGRWRQPGFPHIGIEVRGVVVRLPDGFEAATLLDPAKADLPYVWAKLSEHSDAEPADARFIIVASDDGVRMVWRLTAVEERLAVVTVIPAGGSGTERIGFADQTLVTKSVAVVGCGSAGSKIATTLARAGVGSFVLVDDDVLMRGNLVRNDMDWQGVGEHKAAALGTRLKLINPDVAVTYKLLRLGGQEASSSIDATLELVSVCDLIVDATANGDSFNLVSSVAARSSRPLVWLEVYEGGIGGMVARHRPGIEPSPKDMRSVYLARCRDLNVPWLATDAGAYASDAGDGRILVADDAEVGIIAGHAARFALDTLLQGNAFPHPIYLIGLRAAWIFSQPFEVHPLDVALPQPTVEAGPTEEDRMEAVEFLRELLDEGGDENPAS